MPSIPITLLRDGVQDLVACRRGAVPPRPPPLRRGIVRSARRTMHQVG